MNEIKIKLLLIKNLTDQRNLDLKIVKLVSVLPDICWSGCYYRIQNYIYSFSEFSKNFNLRTENI